MTERGEEHAALVDALRRAAVAPERVVEAFARVPREHFLPGVERSAVYADDAVVTRTGERGRPTSSSSQPSLMAAMLGRLDPRPGHRVLEVGAGTGYNAALLADLVAPGGSVTALELQPEVAEAATANLERAGVRGVDVVQGDAAAPPPGPFDRIVVTAGCWALPAPLVDALTDGGVLVAPLRVNALEIAVPLERSGAVLSGTGGVPCGFMPLRAVPQRPWTWDLGTGGVAAADADLGTEGHGALDRLLAAPARPVEDTGLEDDALDALLWLGLRGDPLISLVRTWPEGGRPPWLIGLASLPGSLLIAELDRGAVASLELHGTDAALRAWTSGLEAWRAAGSPSAAALHVEVEPHAGRDLGGLPAPRPDGGADVQRGPHRWTFRWAPTAAT